MLVLRRNMHHSTCCTVPKTSCSIQSLCCRCGGSSKHSQHIVCSQATIHVELYALVRSLCKLPSDKAAGGRRAQPRKSKTAMCFPSVSREGCFPKTMLGNAEGHARLKHEKKMKRGEAEQSRSEFLAMTLESPRFESWGC